FFQAEDGIRDLTVTGVQSVLFRSSSFGDGGTLLNLRTWNLIHANTKDIPVQGRINQVLPVRFNNTEYTLELTDFRPLNIENFGRSEERRVGKECRFRWERYHYKKK